MKKFLLALIVIIITSSMILVGVSCTTMAAAQTTKTEFIGSDFELSLPEGWEGGNKEELDSVVEKLKDIGQDQLADKVEASKFDLLFFGYDSEAAALGSSVNDFTITGEPAAFLSLDEYMELSYTSVEEVYEKAGYKFKIVEQNVVHLGNYEEVGRVIFEQTIEGIKTKVAQYIIKHDSDFWVLTFTTELEQFDQNIQTFDNTVETFKIIE
ncbi:hypothetical protein ES702_05379 [subsurface metagenome]